MNGISRRADITRSPTTPGQRRDWNVHHEGRATSFLNLSVVFLIQGGLQEEVLRRAVGSLVARHEQLRSRFEDANGALVQVIEPAKRSSSPRLSVENGSGSGPDGHREWARTFVERSFSLHSEAPFRIGIHNADGDGQALAIVMHHIISDRLSLGVAVRDLNEFILAEIECRSPRLPDIPLRFADYASWWEEQRSSGGFTRNFDFWRSQLDDAPIDLGLPIRAAPRSAARYVQHIPETLAEGLQRGAAALRTTPYVVLLTAFSGALFEATSKADQVLQCGYANRQPAALRHAVGRFSSNMALRIRATSEDPAGQLRSIHAVAMRAYTNAVVSLDAVDESGVLPRRHAPDAMTTVAFQLVEGVDHYMSVPGLDIAAVPISPGSTQDLLDVVVERIGERLTLHVVFCPEALDPSWIVSLASRFISHLDRLLASGAP
ncbi:condensation domain-containing protein [Frankia sp. R43]|uniref:condensation domain-containing protein n=1 Tax=Frankia sp. R43 TaxID=269536 RepID=UPI000AF6F7CF|nr:condensation domain-containing protein [Frankia sp. R43]